MSSNSFGKILTVTTFGESHGPAIGCVVDGCPPGMAIAAEDFRIDLGRRATGTSRYTSQRHETDDIEILSGVFEGRTTGTPIALLIRNTDARSKDYAELAETFRPGHADYTYWQKYGIRDPRGGGRSSARETTMRVAAGVIAKKWLREKFNVVVRGWLAALGPLTPTQFDWDCGCVQSVLLARRGDAAGAGILHRCAAQNRRFNRCACERRRRKRAGWLGRAHLRET